MRRMIITALAAALTLVTTPSQAWAAPVLLTGEQSRYPHALRLEHGPQRGSILVVVHGDHAVNVLKAPRTGKRFKRIATFVDDASASETCCGHLYELPRQVGDMPAGTVLWAGSVGTKPETLKARIWRSDDAGQSWRFLSECARARPGGGLWEPDLSVDAYGLLHCYFSDESDGAHSQYIGRTTSKDGITWSAKEKIVAVAQSYLRPGMQQVKRLPTGEYYMMYEICAQPDQYFCEAFHRSSRDGADWGDPTNHGTRPTTKDGKYFAHTPSIVLAPNGTATGRVLLMGQMLMSANGKVDPGNGRTIFVSENGGRSGWYEMRAPVPVPQARDKVCPNYHPSGVASLDGSEFIGFASDYTANGGCHTSWATTSLPPFPG
ncbi:hypothetical protein [Lentzea sp. CA-135723]|uniref:hypothetical protein n=1 Tax=Lentzea sp. CA-135723 TaxID=3239950 RepID=UPI003D8C58FC